MMRTSSILTGILAVLTLSTAAVADTLVLANGDRLTGEVVREHDGVIVFRSAVLGELRVENTHATIARESAATESATVTVIAPSTTPASTPILTKRANPLRRDDDSEWKRQVELGLSAQDGLRDQSNLSVRLEASRADAAGSTSFLVSHHSGKTDGVRVADATRANALLTRNLTDDLFVRGATRFDRDPVAGLGHDAEQSLGLGYTVVNRQTLQLSVGAGAAVRHRSTERDPAGWDGLVDAFGRVKYALTDRLSLSQDFSVTAAPDGGDDFNLKSQTALVNKLTDVLRMTVRYEYEYIGAAHAAVSARQRLVTAIGCVF